MYFEETRDINVSNLVSSGKEENTTLAYNINDYNASGRSERGRATIGFFITYVLPIVCVIGMFGNILILIVMESCYVKKSIKISERVVHAGLVSLAVSDLLYNIVVLPTSFLKDGIVFARAGSFELYYALYGTGLITLFSLISTWLIVMTSFLRFCGVCHPLHARYLIKRPVTIAIIVAVWFACTLSTLPQFWIFEANLFNGSTKDNVTMMILDLGRFSHQTSGGRIYVCCKALYTIFLPAALLLFFNIRLIMSLRDSVRLHRNHVIGDGSVSRYRENHAHRLTHLFAAMVIMFVVLVFPGELLDFFLYLIPGISIDDNDSVIFIRAFTNWLQISNFAFNFLLYCLMNGTFRKGLVLLFRFPRSVQYIDTNLSRRNLINKSSSSARGPKSTRI